MTVVAIDNTLRKLLQTTSVGSYNSLYYEILTLLANPDLANDLSRYNRLFNDSILPGEFQYDLHVKQRVLINNIEEIRKQLSFRFCSLLSNITTKRHQQARYYSEEHLKVYKKFLASNVRYAIAWSNFIKSLDQKPELVLIYNGTLSFESFIRTHCKENKIDYETSETYVGTNSWIYKVKKLLNCNTDRF